MILEWNKLRSNLKLAWVGPTNIKIPAQSMEDVEKKIAVIAGPPGRKGDKGDAGTTIIERVIEQAVDGQVLDGGNF